jgi:hypothetical protein
MAQRTATALEADMPQHPVGSGNALRILDAPDFQLVLRSQCSPNLLREVCDFLDGQDASHPFQLPQWSGERAYLACLRRQGQLRWFAQCGVHYPAGRFLRPIRALMVNRGPVCDDLELMETGLRELLRKAREMRIAYIDIAPEWTGTFAESASAVLERNGGRSLPGERTSLRLDLRPRLEDLLSSFRKSTRYEIRRSEAEGVKVTIAGNDADCDEFLRLYRAMANEKQFEGMESDCLMPLLRWLAADPNRGGLFLAREDGALTGGAFVVRSGARCWYILGATAKGGKFSAGHLLQWRAMQWAKEHGCVEYDFCGLREGVNSGPALFKRGFSGQVVHFLPPHRYIVGEGRYRAAEVICQARRSIQRSPRP